VEKKKIGLKVADGSFYPILDGDAQQKKRMVLTTVKDNQESVQIDLYRGAGEGLEDAQYIGSLMVENITPGEKGSPEIELDIGVDADGQLETVAMDKASGAKQSLSVSLKSLEDEGLYDVPDFSFDEDETVEVLEEELPTFSKEDILDENIDMSGLETPSGEELLEEPIEEQTPDLDSDVSDLDFEEPLEEDLDMSGLELPPDDFTAVNPEEFREETLEETAEETFKESSGDESSDFDTEDFDMDFDEDEYGSGETDDTETEPQWEQEYTRLNEGFEEDTEEAEKEKPGRGRPFLIALLVILALALIGALLYLFVLSPGDEEVVPPLEAQQEQEAVAESPDDTGEETVEPPAPAESEADEAGEPAVETGPSDAEPPAGPLVSPGSGGPGADTVEFTGGVWYKIRWGDTLWEISSSFYDNPWLYGQIADENEIPNPDRIFAEDSIFIPRK